MKMCASCVFFATICVKERKSADRCRNRYRTETSLKIVGIDSPVDFGRFWKNRKPKNRFFYRNRPSLIFQVPYLHLGHAGTYFCFRWKSTLWEILTIISVTQQTNKQTKTNKKCNTPRLCPLWCPGWQTRERLRRCRQRAAQCGVDCI